jgi:hypothetical protein
VASAVDNVESGHLRYTASIFCICASELLFSFEKYLLCLLIAFVDNQRANVFLKETGSAYSPSCYVLFLWFVQNSRSVHRLAVRLFRSMHCWTKHVRQVRTAGTFSQPRSRGGTLPLTLYLAGFQSREINLYVLRYEVFTAVKISMSFRF